MCLSPRAPLRKQDVLALDGTCLGQHRAGRRRCTRVGLSKMPDLRISIVGSSGSGKSTLARRLHERAGLPWLELDGVYHQADWQPLDDEAFHHRVDEFLTENASWVIDGNYPVVRERIWAQATHVVWLDPSRFAVIRQILWRTFSRWICREELWNGNREQLRDVLSPDPDRSIVLWAWTGHPVCRRTYEVLLAEPRWSRLGVDRLKNRAAVDAWLAGLSER